MISVPVLLLHALTTSLFVIASGSEITIKTDPQDAIVCTGQNLTIYCLSSSTNKQVSYCILQDDGTCAESNKIISNSLSSNASAYVYTYLNVSKEDDNQPIRCKFNDNAIEPSDIATLKVIYSIPQVRSTDINVSFGCDTLTINWPAINSSANYSYMYIIEIAQVNYSIADPPLPLELDQFQDGERYNVSISPFVAVCKNIVNFTTTPEFKVQKGNCSDDTSSQSSSTLSSSSPSSRPSSSSSSSIQSRLRSTQTTSVSPPSQLPPNNDGSGDGNEVITATVIAGVIVVVIVLVLVIVIVILVHLIRTHCHSENRENTSSSQLNFGKIEMDGSYLAGQPDLVDSDGHSNGRRSKQKKDSQKHLKENQKQKSARSVQLHGMKQPKFFDNLDAVRNRFSRKNYSS